MSNYNQALRVFYYFLLCFSISCYELSLKGHRTCPNLKTNYQGAPLFSPPCLTKHRVPESTCKFSHCCINSGCNFYIVLSIYAIRTRFTLYSQDLQYPKNHYIFLPGRDYSELGRGTKWREGECIIVPRQGGIILTHTVDSKQPWTNGNSEFFSHSVFYFFMV